MKDTLSKEELLQRTLDEINQRLMLGWQVETVSKAVWQDPDRNRRVMQIEIELVEN
jgi:hypothetical protein